MFSLVFMIDFQWSLHSNMDTHSILAIKYPKHGTFHFLASGARKKLSWYKNSQSSTLSIKFRNKNFNHEWRLSVVWIYLGRIFPVWILVRTGIVVINQSKIDGKEQNPNKFITQDLALWKF